MAVDQRIGNEVSTLLGVEDVHGTEMLVSFLYADYLLGNLDGIAVLGVKSGYECIRISGFHHHHTEIVAFEHLVDGFLIVGSFAGTLFAQDACVSLAAFRFAVVAQVDDFDTLQVQVELFGQFGDTFFISQNDRRTDTFCLGFHGCFQHVGVCTFGEYHALRAAAGCIVQLSGEFVFLSHQFAQVVLVSLPVGNLLACHSRFHGSFGYGHGHFGNQTRVDRFRNEVFGTETQVVYVVSLIHHIRHRLFGQSGDGSYGSQFHLFVDGSGLCVEGTAEDIRESDYVVDLVRIVRTSGSHQYVGA